MDASCCCRDIPLYITGRLGKGYNICNKYIAREGLKKFIMILKLSILAWRHQFPISAPEVSPHFRGVTSDGEDTSEIMTHLIPHFSLEFKCHISEVSSKLSLPPYSFQ